MLIFSFGTNYLEEGIDVHSCIVVIQISRANTLVEYLQSRERCRQKWGWYVDMDENMNEKRIEGEDDGHDNIIINNYPFFEVVKEQRESPDEESKEYYYLNEIYERISDLHEDEIKQKECVKKKLKGRMKNNSSSDKCRISKEDTSDDNEDNRIIKYEDCYRTEKGACLRLFSSVYWFNCLCQTILKENYKKSYVDYKNNSEDNKKCDVILLESIERVIGKHSFYGEGNNIKEDKRRDELKCIKYLN